MMKPKRRSLAITGAASAVAVLALGASAIASNRSSGRAVQPRTLTVARTGTLTTVVTPGMTKDVTVLDAGTVTILVDDVAGTFKVSKVVVNVGWQADTSVPDGTHAAIAFTATARTVNVTLVLDSGVLTVTIIEVPPTSTPSMSGCSVRASALSGLTLPP